MNRRAFFAALAGASAYAVVPKRADAFPTIPDRPEPDLESAASWIAFHDGRYTLVSPRAEMGQNISTALKKIACAELGVAWKDVDVSYGDTASVAPYRATVGSDSVQDFALPLAQACAALRDAIAAGRTGRIEPTERRWSELRAFAPEAVRSDAPLVGGDAIVTGAPLFAADIRLPGMLFGRVMRADASPEIDSRPRRWNVEAAQAERGFVALVESADLDLNNSRGLGVVAKTPGALERIEAALDIEWSAAERPDQAGIDAMIDVDRRIDRGGARYALANDRLDKDAFWDVDLRIDTPLAAHGAIEPRAAVAEMDRRGGRVWAGSQDVFFVRDMLIDRLDLDADQVTIVPQRIGGAFGGKVIPTVEIEAAVLSRAIRRPVKVQWTRAQEMTFAYHRPPTSHRVRARLENGRIRDWSHRFASGHVIFTNAVLPAWMQFFTDFIGDDGAARNALPPYDFPAKEIGYDLERLPVRTAAWRGLGAGPNTLAIEMAMEACARTAGAAPIEFRRRHVSDPRLAAVLSAVEDLAGPPPARGRGVGCGIYKGVSYGAVVADAAFDQSGAIVVRRVFCAHDCGHVIDPDQVRAQCEGNVMWSLGMALFDRLTLGDGSVVQRNFLDAPIPQISDAPEISVRLLQTDHPPSGAGETLMASAPAAIVNAISSLTGETPTRLPVGA